MAAFTASIPANRWLDQLIVQGTLANVDAARVDTLALPPGTGDVAIMEWTCRVFSIATLTASLEQMSIHGEIVSAGPLNILDVAGQGRWFRTGADEVVAYVQPDALVLWRQDEILQVRYPELDTNAAPTADVELRVRAVRVRPQEPPIFNPAIRLVR